jgi:hypothetical protein
LKSDNFSISVKYSIPGNFLPSNNSKEAPPPVDKWVIVVLAPGTELTKVIVSPPPQTVWAPFLVASTIDYNQN